MRSFDEWNAGRFLRAGDYDPGDSFAVTVTKVTEEELQRDHGLEPVLILTLAREDGHWGDYAPNLTARRTLARLFGRDPMDLVGKQFVLVVVITGFEGRNGFVAQPAARPMARQPRLRRRILVMSSMTLSSTDGRAARIAASEGAAWLSGWAAPGGESDDHPNPTNLLEEAMNEQEWAYLEACRAGVAYWNGKVKDHREALDHAEARLSAARAQLAEAEGREDSTISDETIERVLRGNPPPRPVS
jgi:hypothetical protein